MTIDDVIKAAEADGWQVREGETILSVGPRHEIVDVTHAVAYSLSTTAARRLANSWGMMGGWW